MKALFAARVLVLVLGWAGMLAATAAQEIQFSGFTWRVREGEGGPGPNRWSSTNVWVDGHGHLHLAIRQREGRWTCAEVILTQRLGFGRYEFEVEGRFADLDDQIVLGLFNYPPRDVGGDATHEIDIEFARWGRPDLPLGNYTVWPVDPALKPTSHTFAFSPRAPVTTHEWKWSSTALEFRSWQSGEGSPTTDLASWVFRPADWRSRIAQKPMPMHFNLWLFQGRPPKNQQEVEFVIRRFRFTPEGAP